MKIKSCSIHFLKVFLASEVNTSLESSKPECLDQIFEMPSDLIRTFELAPLKITVKSETIHNEYKVYPIANVYSSNVTVINLRFSSSNSYMFKQEFFNVDEFIYFQSINGKNERWNIDSSGQHQIEHDFYSIDIESNEVLPDSISGGSEVIEDIFFRYIKFYFKTEPNHFLNYTICDIWEDIDLDDGKNYDSISKMKEIRASKKKEIIGIMSSYPFEWLYRKEKDFSAICGDDIGIDEDDMVLVNDSCCLIFGTYGLRGENSKTDWKSHLTIRDQYLISWPEYCYLLEFSLARKFYLQSLIDEIKNLIIVISNKKVRSKTLHLSYLRIINAIKKFEDLDAIKMSKYISHRVMFERTQKELGIDKLEEKFQKTHLSVLNLIESFVQLKEMFDSKKLNFLVGIFTIAALFQTLFLNVKLPILQKYQSEAISSSVASIIIIINGIFLTGGILFFLIQTIKNAANRQRK